MSRDEKIYGVVTIAGGIMLTLNGIGKLSSGG